MTEKFPLWPTWNNEKRRLNHHMPFDERFWREDRIHDEKFTWDAQSRAKETAPTGVKGFLVALPTFWTAGESNISGMNNFLVANNIAPSGIDENPEAVTIVASHTSVTPDTVT